MRRALLFLVAVSAWAVSAPGVPNFHQVNDNLYRGGQPSAEGFRSLKALGIHTIIDLRIPAGQSNWERKIVESLGMLYVHIPMRGKETPSQAEIDKAFSYLNDSSRWPVYVHCREGKDRTGMIIGCYRVAHDEWTNRRALAEAKSYAARELTHAMEDYILHFDPTSLGASARNAVK